MTASFLGGATPSGCSPITPVGRLSAKDAGAAEEQKVKINYDTKKEDKGVALLLGLHWPVRRNWVLPTQKLGKPLLQFVLPCPQLRSVADEAL